MDKKFRYVFKHNINHSIAFYFFTLDQIERGEALKLLAKLELEWTVIARDEWTGKTDKNGKELYHNDNVLIGLSFDERYEYLIIWSDECGQWLFKDSVEHLSFSDVESKELEASGTIYEI